MALRATQQAVDVLSEATGGKLRVTQYYIEAIGIPGVPESVSNALALTDAVVEAVVHTESVSDNLGLSDNAIGSDGLNQVLNDTLSFSDLVTSNLHSQSLQDTLAFIDSVFAPHLVADVMALVDSLITNIKAGMASDVMALTDQALSNYHTLFDPISFVDVAGTNIKPQPTSSAMTLVDTVSFVKIHNLADNLPVVDQVQRAITFPRAVASPITFLQTVEMFIDRSGELCLYAPNVGTGPRTIPTIAPTITPSTLTLFWPVVSPSITVVLRNPEFGNKIAYNPNRINRKSRGGKVMVFRDPDWPQFTLLDMNISMLNQTQIDDFKSFLTNTLGQLVGVIDHDGFVWNGVIITPDTAITQLSGTVSCPDYASSFQFEGQQVS